MPLNAQVASAKDVSTSDEVDDLIRQILKAQNPHEILSIKHNATLKDATARYKQIARKIHPDKTDKRLASDAFKKAVNALEHFKNVNQLQQSSKRIEVEAVIPKKTSFATAEYQDAKNAWGQIQSSKSSTLKTNCKAEVFKKSTCNSGGIQSVRMPLSTMSKKPKESEVLCLGHMRQSSPLVSHSTKNMNLSQSGLSKNVIKTWAKSKVNLSVKHNFKPKKTGGKDELSPPTKIDQTWVLYPCTDDDVTTSQSTSKTGEALGRWMSKMTSKKTPTEKYINLSSDSDCDSDGIDLLDY